MPDETDYPRTQVKSTLIFTTNTYANKVTFYLESEMHLKRGEVKHEVSEYALLFFQCN